MRLRVFAGEVRGRHQTSTSRGSMRGLLMGVFCFMFLAASASAVTGNKRSHDEQNQESALRAILNGFVGSWHVDVFEKRDLAPPAEWKHSYAIEWTVELRNPR
jgi:hypothetical protein